MKALRYAVQGLHFALHVYDNGIHRAGHNGKLLLQKIAGNRYAMTQENLACRAAHAGKINAFGPLRFG